MTGNGSDSPIPPVTGPTGLAETEAVYAPAVDRSELREAILTSVQWVAAGRIAGQAVTFGSAIALARLIPPAEFGRAAVALIVVALALVLTLQGFGAALVRFPSLERSHIESAALLSVVTGVSLTGVTFLLAPIAFEPAFGSKVARFIQIASPAWTLAAFGAIPLALLQRRLDFRRISLIEIWSLLIGTATSLSAAASGMDGEALILGALAATGSASFFFLRSVPLTMPRWNTQAAREVATFGLPVALSSLAYTAFLNVDYAMLGARVGAAQVGFYWRAYQVAVEYQGKISGILLRVALPVYSRSNDLEDMKRMRARISRLHATLLFAPLLALIPLAPQLVPLLFGGRWHDAVVPTQILVAAGMVAAISTGIGPLLVAAGKAAALLWFNLASLIAYGAMVYLVAPDGLKIVCTAVSAYEIASVAILYGLVERLIGIPALRLAADALPGLVSGGALLAVAFPLTSALSDAGVPRALIVVVVSAAGAAVYALVLRLAFRAAWADLVLLLTRVLPSGRLTRSGKTPVTPAPVSE
jgi:lipopolysaccharide exporter